MGHLPVPETTHTLELAQLAELNARLREHHRDITASDLGVTGAPGSAVLVRLCWDGPPEFPYVHAHFAVKSEGTGGRPGGHRGVPTGPGTGPVLDLHTAALRELSARLGLRQQWGA